MSKTSPSSPGIAKTTRTFHIVASRFNEQYVDGLVDHVTEELRALRGADAHSRGRGGNRVQYLLFTGWIVDKLVSAEFRRGDLIACHDPLDRERGETAKRVRWAARPDRGIRLLA